MTPACSAVSPPISAQPGLPAALVHAGHDGGDPVRVDLARGDVVEHEERLGPDADQVVDAHGHQVDADGVVAAGGPGHHQLGAHPVGGGDQHGVRCSGPMSSGNWPPKPPMPGHHRRRMPLDGGVAGGDVDAGARVGGAALAHGAQTPGSAAWCADATGSGRPIATGVDAARARASGSRR